MSKFVTAPIEGVVLRRLEKHEDPRGWLIELFRRDEMDPAVCPVMCYVSQTRPGVSRGPHEHRGQTDLFCFIGPSTFRVYAWDNRPSAGDAPHAMVWELGESLPASLIVPPGVVHGYRNVGDRPGWVINCASALYRGWGRTEPVDEIRYEDVPDCPFRME